MLKINIDTVGNLPVYKTEEASGADLIYTGGASVTLDSLERSLFKTGTYIALPEGFEAQIRPRSGLALKKGITVLNTPGTIDSDYRGEIGVILVNLSQYPVTINPGERIAQIIVSPVVRGEFNKVEVLGETARGAGGFGHTGV